MSQYRKLIKAEYVVCCKMTKLLPFFSLKSQSLWKTSCYRKQVNLFLYVTPLLNDNRVLNSFFRPQFSDPHKYIRALDLMSFCHKNSEVLFSIQTSFKREQLSIFDYTNNLLESEIQNCKNNNVDRFSVRFLNILSKQSSDVCRCLALYNIKKGCLHRASQYGPTSHLGRGLRTGLI